MRFSIVIFLGLGAWACTPTEEQLRPKLLERASFDLDCPANQLDVVDLDGPTRGVSGCGRRGSYIAICQFSACTWMAQGPLASGPEKGR
jgi:hypothetical protein